MGRITEPASEAHALGRIGNVRRLLNGVEHDRRRNRNHGGRNAGSEKDAHGHLAGSVQKVRSASVEIKDPDAAALAVAGRAE